MPVPASRDCSSPFCCSSLGESWWRWPLRYRPSPFRAWHLTHTHLGPVSPTTEQYEWLLAGLAVYALVLAGINWVNRGENGPRKALRYLGIALLLPWCLGLLYLGRLYY
ncbi:MAG: hypothetical protein QM805_25165 [Pseudomonas sp.]